MQIEDVTQHSAVAAESEMHGKSLILFTYFNLERILITTEG